MSLILNRAKVVTATTGTGTVTLGAAVVPFQTWAAAQAGTTSTTRRYSYLIEEGNAWEIGEGIYNETADTLTRNLVASSTGSLLSLTGSATVACVSKAADAPQVIEKKVFTGSESSFTFSDIPQDFTSLELEVMGRIAGAGSSSLNFQVNGLSTAIYDYQRIYGLGAVTPTADNTVGATSMSIGSFMGTSFAADRATYAKVDIFGYTTPFHKGYWNRIRWAGDTGIYNGYLLEMSGNIRVATAITSLAVLTISPGTFVAGGYAVLRGIP